MIAGIADHGVAGLEDRNAAEVRLVAVVNTTTSSVPIRSTSALGCSVWKRVVAVQEPRAGDPGAVGLEGVAGGLLDPCR